MLGAVALAMAAVTALAAADSSITPPPLTAEQIFARVVERNRQQASQLNGYSVRRTDSAENTAGKVYAVEEVRMNFTAPEEKAFDLLSGRGSWVVRDLVFHKLREAETTAARGKDHADSSITPANYRFQMAGMEEAGGRLCYVVQATPLHRNKYLFEGRVWIDAAEFAVVRIEGHPSANPSFWTRHIEFVRSYAKAGDF